MRVKRLLDEELGMIGHLPQGHRHANPAPRSDEARDAAAAEEVVEQMAGLVGRLGEDDRRLLLTMAEKLLREQHGGTSGEFRQADKKRASGTAGFEES